MLRFPNPLLTATLCVLAQAGTAYGQINWKQTTAEVRAAPGALPATALEARYPFENTSRAAVNITHLESDCGCTVPELDKRHYEPGEKGEITARFSVGEQTGREEKHVTVTLSGQAAPTVLTLVVLIPEFLRFEPSSLSWDRGEPNAPKKIDIGAGGIAVVKMLTVHSSQALFAAELRTLEAGRHYELAVTPARTDQALSTRLTFSGRFALVATVTSKGNPGEVLDKTMTVSAMVKSTLFKSTPPRRASE